MGKRISLVGLVALAASLTMLCGCGTVRGIPFHGGGKRFFIEQELVAATARATAKDINVAPLKGQKCALYVISMGDQGSGSLIGGRYAIDALIRGSYDNSASVITESDFPILPSTATTTTTDGVGALLSTAVTNSTAPINAPSRTKQETRGPGFSTGGGARLNWPGDYRAEAFINPKDALFLNAVINEALALKGVLVVPPQAADVDVYVTVDAFGTCRDRTEFLVYNAETLTAKTGMSMCAFDRRNGKLLLPPTTSVFEAVYKEEFILWCGPIKRSKDIKRGENLLVDFKGLSPDGGSVGEVGVPTDVTPRTPGVTRPKDLTQPLPKPDPSRPEDLP